MRDEKKNRILATYGIPYIIFSPTGGTKKVSEILTSELKVGDIVYIKGFNECGAIEVVHENFIDKIVRYKVKTNNNEYTLLGRMLEPIDINLQHTQNLEQRIEKLEKEVFKPVEIHDRPKEKSLLTEDERVILRNIDKKYEWITKDIDGDLYVFEERPYKCENNYWRSRNEFDGDYIGVIFNHIFKSLTTEKPYNIEELLKGESKNEKRI